MQEPIAYNDSCSDENTQNPPVLNVAIAAISPVATGMLVNDDGDANEVVQFASWLMAEQKAQLTLSSLDTVIFLFRQVIDGSLPTHPLHSNALKNLATALDVRSVHTSQLSDLEESLKVRRDIWTNSTGQTPLSINAPIAQPEDDIEATSELAIETLTNFNQSTSLATLDTVLVLLQQALPHLVLNESTRLMGLITLGYALYLRHHHPSNTVTNSLDKGIYSTMEDAFRSCTSMVEKRQLGVQIFVFSVAQFDISGDISHLHSARKYLDTMLHLEDVEGCELKSALELYSRFSETGDMQDLDAAIKLFRDEMPSLIQSSDNYMKCLDTLPKALCTRFEQRGQPGDLDEAIHLHRRALELRPLHHPARPGTLNNLAAALQTRFSQGGRYDVLAEVISLNRQALELLPIPHPERSIVLNNLANALWTRFEQTGQHGDLDEAILVHRQALGLRPPPHPKQFASLNNLANALMTRYKQDGQYRDLDEAISLHRQALELLPLPNPNRSSSLNNLANALRARFEQEGLQNDLDEAISLLKQALGLLSLTHVDRTAFLNNLANALASRFNQTGVDGDLDEAISLHRQVLRSLPASHPNLSGCLNNLANVLRIRFEHQYKDGDLDEAISLQRKSLELLSVSHPVRFRFLNNLANLVRIRHEQSGLHTDRDEAISLQRQVVSLTSPSDPDLSSALNNLAIALRSRFQQEHQRTDLDEAISLNREALRLRPPHHPERAMSFYNLANVLKDRFERDGQQSDIDESISLHKTVPELLPVHHPRISSSLSSLASALRARFSQGGSLTDLDNAISLQRQALELQASPHPDRPMSLNDLANALHTRFSHTSDVNDLEESISLHKHALEQRPSPHPDRSMSLNNLANVLQTRFQRTGQGDDLDEAISCNRRALELLPTLHPYRSGSLTNMANTLQMRFEQGGQPSDLDEAISLQRQALELRPPPHPERFASLSNLANVLQTRHDRTGQDNDLDELISLHRQALELIPSAHYNRTMSLNNLAIALLTRFRKRGEKAELDEAESLQKEALELLPANHRDRHTVLNNLACTLSTQFSHGGHAITLDEAISTHRRALELQSPSHFDRSPSLDNLGMALHTRYEKDGQESDLDEAISLYHQALELRPPPHIDRSVSLNNLASSLVNRYNRGGQRNDLEEAISLSREATQYRFQHPSRRFDMSQAWIRLAEGSQHDSLLAAYEASLEILPQVAALALTVESRQKAMISGTDGLARDASRCAMRLGDLSKSIEFLEAGRSVFWSQVLSLRSPFDALRNVEPNGSTLADRLQAVARELEIGGHREISAHPLDNGTRLSIDQESSRLNRLNEEWDEILMTVRKFPGFEEFLHPPRISSLQAAASQHPVVFLIANSDESHCLIMTSEVIHHIPLPNLKARFLGVLVENVRMASSSFVTRSLIDKTRRVMTEILGEERGISYQDPEDSDGTFRFVLQLLWEEVVNPVIDFLAIKKSSSDLSTIQWCPTGHFTFLPIHAAGIYDANNLSIDCAADYFISSYTPTIGVLLSGQSSSISEAFKMMAVIQPQELPSTTMELNKIRSHVSDDSLIAFGDPGIPAFVETVASLLPDASIVHFACHGHQDALHPLDSGLKLDDGQLRISRIMKEKMPNGALAFLSACETAMGDANIPDEAMSLAAGLLFCGFKRVVATMWMMRDEDGPSVADAFYHELFQGPDGAKTNIPDVTKSAYALHIAVKELRSKKVSFRRWVPFIHMGTC